MRNVFKFFWKQIGLETKRDRSLAEVSSLTKILVYSGNTISNDVLAGFQNDVSNNRAQG